ncbi:hypothetical protein [Parapedobacter pyrenivorans]|uniref:hypothetical protein n=1 Tax=Parapedobacter pyrenivorans TaxID=1305674 RepID=UPI00334212B8
MRKRHQVDELFKEGLSDPDIPFNEGDWKALSRKLRTRRKRVIPLVVWIGGGIAAAVIIVAMVLFGRREELRDDAVASTVPHRTAVDTSRNDSTATASAEQSPASAVEITERHRFQTFSATAQPQPAGERSRSLVMVQSLKPIGVLPSNKPTIPRDISITRVVPPSDITSPVLANPQPLKADDARQGWAFSVMAAPDLSGTQPLSGKFGGNIGLMATYRINDWLSVSAGAGYAKKLYEADFADYKPRFKWGDRQGTPSFVAANCIVLDIPLNINVDIKQYRRSTWFVSAGVSSYFMLSETYDYIYPPHEYGYPNQFTLRNENQHILGVGNLGVGYRRQIGPKLGIAVQPFVKVPLTGIGNGNLKLYSSGVAISADIDLSRRMKRQ